MTGMLTWKKTEIPPPLRKHFAQAEAARGAHTPDVILRHRVRAASGKLRRLGVTQVVLPSFFPWDPERWGLFPVSTLPLRHMLAADWVQWKLADSAADCVAVSADRLTGEVIRTVTELAFRYRYVLLNVPGGSEALRDRLRREYGISLRTDRENLKDTAVLAAFDPLHTPCVGPEIIPLYDEGSPLPPLHFSPELEALLPDGMNRAQLLAAMWEEKILRPEQIAVGKIASDRAGS